MWDRLKAWAQRLKADTIALWFCCSHPGTPRSAKVAAALVVAYALSPIDLIPDFIPVLGYLDDLLLVPIGIYLALKLVPPLVIDECRAKARDHLAARQALPCNYIAAAVVVALWILMTWVAWRWISATMGWTTG